MKMLHELKIDAKYIEDIIYFGKSFEVRKDDSCLLYTSKYLIG